MIGAIGVSGNTPQEDEEIARAGLSGLDAAVKGSSGSPATYIPAVQLQAAFAKGEFLLRTEAYKVEAGRRTAPGKTVNRDQRIGEDVGAYGHSIGRGRCPGCPGLTG